MNFKVWTKFFITILILFVLLNYIIWVNFTQFLLSDIKHQGGDLARLGYVYDSKQIRPEINNKLLNKYLENYQYTNQKIDVLTIGDSFSNGGGGGGFYQNYISSKYSLTVLNIQPYYNTNYIETIMILLNSGYLDKVHPKYIIIESIERDVVNRFNKKIDSNITANEVQVSTYYKKAQYKSSSPTYTFINSGNFNFILYNILYNYSDHAFFSECYKTNLDKSLFNVKNDHTLLFYKGDIKNIKQVNTETINNVNNNLNTLSIKLKNRGIKLYFMPAVDKYDLYYNFIDKKKYPKNMVFDEFRKIPNKEYYFIDTKNILLNELSRGEQDIYYADDTHWSEKGYKKVIDSIIFNSKSN